MRPHVKSAAAAGQGNLQHQQLCRCQASLTTSRSSVTHQAAAGNRWNSIQCVFVQLCGVRTGKNLPRLRDRLHIRAGGILRQEQDQTSPLYMLQIGGITGTAELPAHEGGGCPLSSKHADDTLQSDCAFQLAAGPLLSKCIHHLPCSSL